MLEQSCRPGEVLAIFHLIGVCSSYLYPTMSLPGGPATSASWSGFVAKCAWPSLQAASPCINRSIVGGRVHASLPKRPRLPPPPSLKVHCRSINPQILQRLTRKMAIIWTLHSSLRIVTLSVSHHAIQRQPHDFRKQLTDLVFRESVFGGEL